MKPNFDTSKIANGNRPFDYKPPPISIQAAYWIGAFLIVLAASQFIASIWAAATFGITQFAAVFAFGAVLAILGCLICAFAQACKATFDNLQINAYRGKNG